MGLATAHSGFLIVELDSIDSSNEEAKRRALHGAPAGLVIWPRQQTQGRGRHGRSWSSPRGNLHVSFLLRPQCPIAQALQIGFVASLAVAATVADLLTDAHDVRCKWPNDVLVNGRKVAGLLLESASDSRGQVAWLVLGIGLNVAWRPDDVAGAFCATSLAHEGVGATDLRPILDRLCGRIDDSLAEWKTAGFAAVRNRWLGIAYALGEQVSVRLADETASGRFVGLDASGAMLLSDERGVERLICAGDVFPPELKAEPLPVEEVKVADAARG
ncbi:MAG: biotin--[acetyl-CoA-carboxylase] ligase [Rhodospirillales bacterium]|nr:biotin--[acetyl-CoA-carboxylase] ligase [Rhodospirillales bacterium]